MSNSILPPPRVPLDVIFLILEHLLPSLPIGTSNNNVHSTYTNIMLLSRTIYSTTIARIYHTAIVRTTTSLRNFRATLTTSSHLGPLVHNLWINHEPEVPKSISRYSITNDALAVVKLAPNLRRLAIASPLYYLATHLDSPIVLTNLTHLVVPSMWLTSSPDVSNSQDLFSRFPANLSAIYVRGRVGLTEANVIVSHCPALRYVTVRVFASVALSDMRTFTHVLVRGLKELRSLELVVLPEQWEDLKSRLRELEWEGEGRELRVEEKTSVSMIEDDEKDELDLWMDESQSTRPAWAQ